MSKAQIMVDAVEKNFSHGGVDNYALKDVSLNIERGEAVVLLGPSGAGKSTLLHCIGALEPVTSGRILIDEQNLCELSDSQLSALRNKKFGFVFQFHHLLPDLSMEENIALPLLIGGCPRAEAISQAHAALTRVGLAGLGGRLPQELSGGEQQRVALARALVNKPEIILADEPTGNLDSKNSAQVFDLLLNLNTECNATLLVVTHNEVLAKRFGRVVRMNNGTIV